MSRIKRIPIVTLLLIASNVAAAFFLVAAPDQVMEIGFLPREPSLVDALACMFLHVNIFHLLGNMVFLAAVGPAVEFAAGPVRFLAVFTLGGLLGVLLHWAFALQAGDDAPLIGASGAVAACAGYFSVRYANLRVAVAPGISVPVTAVVFLWALLQVVGAFVHIGADASSTSYWSHVGGFASGLLLSMVFRAPELASVSFGHDVLQQMNERGPAAAKVAAERHLKAHPGDTKAQWEHADASALLGDVDDEARTVLSILESGADTSRALARLAAIEKIQLIPDHRRIRYAEQIAQSDLETAKALLLSLADDVRSPLQPDALFALASLEIETDRSKANRLLEELVQRHPLHTCVEAARARGWIT